MNRETWAAILANWPITVFIPSILVIIALLSLITRLWDGHQRRRDEEREASGSATGR